MKSAAERRALAIVWMEKASAAVASAKRERAAGELAFAINRIYYGCFYAVSAVLAIDGLEYGKHSGVRAAFHQQIVKRGRIAALWGDFYNRILDSRQEGDYQPVAVFDDADVADKIRKAEQFIAEMNKLLGS